MAFSKEVSNRIKTSLQYFPDAFTEKRMFGGVVFLYKGKMTVGVIKNDLMVRIIDSKMGDELKKEFVRPMDFTGKPMKEFVYVSIDGFKTEEELQYWIELGFEHAKYKLEK